MSNTNKYLLIFICLLAFQLTTAQTVDDTFGFQDTNVSDKTAAPINFLIPLAMVVGAWLGITKFKRKE